MVARYFVPLTIKNIVNQTNQMWSPSSRGPSRENYATRHMEKRLSCTFYVVSVSTRRCVLLLFTSFCSFPVRYSRLIEHCTKNVVKNSNWSILTYMCFKFNSRIGQFRASYRTRQLKFHIVVWVHKTNYIRTTPKCM